MFYFTWLWHDDRMFVCGFVENKSITDLELGWNGIGPEGATTLSDMLKVSLICVMF